MPIVPTTSPRTSRRPSARRLAAVVCLAIAYGWTTSRSVTAAPTLNPIGLSGCLKRQAVPIPVLWWAVSHPSQVHGYGITCNPNVPIGPTNPFRNKLTLINPNVRYHPVFNPLVWRCGCR
jgi:hypothetical protein